MGGFDWKAILGHLCVKCSIPQDIIDDATKVGYDLEQLAVDLVQESANYVINKIVLLQNGLSVPPKV